ncbi:MAG: CopG family transcriptional regulator [Chloroflexota bacterium]
MSPGRKSVSISEELYRKIAERVKTSGFNSVDEYVSFVLEQVIEADSTGKAMSDADETEIKNRLKRLGYFE